MIHLVRLSKRKHFINTLTNGPSNFECYLYQTHHKAWDNTVLSVQVFGWRNKYCLNLSWLSDQGIWGGVFSYPSYELTIPSWLPLNDYHPPYVAHSCDPKSSQCYHWLLTKLTTFFSPLRSELEAINYKPETRHTVEPVLKTTCDETTLARPLKVHFSL